MEDFDILCGMTIFAVIIFTITLMYILWQMNNLGNEQARIDEKLKRLEKKVKQRKR